MIGEDLPLLRIQGGGEMFAESAYLMSIISFDSVRFPIVSLSI
jgi:hypothetical protein